MDNIWLYEFYGGDWGFVVANSYDEAISKLSTVYRSTENVDVFQIDPDCEAAPGVFVTRPV